MRMYKICIEAAEVLIIFVCALVLFACMSRILFFDVVIEHTKESYAYYSYKNFSKAFYSMIVSVSSGNFPISMLNPYRESKFSSIFFILNSFVMNWILLKLIMAVFFFYYQNFYVQNVVKLKRKRILCIKLIEELKKSKDSIIPEDTLKSLIATYNESPENLLIPDSEKENIPDEKYLQLKKSTKERNKEFDLYFNLKETLRHPAYNVLIGIIDIAIFMLTLPNIDSFNNKDPSKQDGSIKRTYLFIQVGLLSISLISQGVGIIGRGFKETFKDYLMTFDLFMTLAAFLLGMVLVSQNDFTMLLGYNFTSSVFKIYCVITVCKNLSVIKFLRRIRELRIVLDVLYKSTIFLMDLIGMMGIIMLLFASIGISMFGGVVNSSNIPNFE